MAGDILLTFIPIFVAVDAPGLLPVFISLTGELDAVARKRAIRQSVATALLLSVGFLLVGEFLFGALHITAGDFLVAGGTILFILAIRSLIQEERPVHPSSDTLGAVPLGTPLIAGPAVLTTSLIMVESYGWLPTLVSLILNLLLAGGIFNASEIIVRLLGVAGIRVVSKITALFLAAIGVLMVRKGVADLLDLIQT